MTALESGLARSQTEVARHTPRLLQYTRRYFSTARAGSRCGDAVLVGPPRHATQVVGSALLVHGTAGVALAAIAYGLARGTAATGGQRRAILGTGLSAAAISLAQFALACIAAAGTTASTSRVLFQSIDFLDALKLALLAAFATVATSAARRTGAAPRWLRISAATLAPLLIAGSAALVGIDAAMPVLELSLLALLAWALGISITVTRRTSN